MTGKRFVQTHRHQRLVLLLCYSTRCVCVVLVSLSLCVCAQVALLLSFDWRQQQQHFSARSLIKSIIRAQHTHETRLVRFVHSHHAHIVTNRTRKLIDIVHASDTHSIFNASVRIHFNMRSTLQTIARFSNGRSLALFTPLPFQALAANEERNDIELVWLELRWIKKKSFVCGEKKLESSNQSRSLARLLACSNRQLVSPVNRDCKRCKNEIPKLTAIYANRQHTLQSRAPVAGAQQTHTHIESQANSCQSAARCSCHSVEIVPTDARTQPKYYWCFMHAHSLVDCALIGNNQRATDYVIRRARCCCCC